MEILLTTEDSIRLTAKGAALAIEPKGDTDLSPFHLLAASLATCTYSVLHSYGGHAAIELDDLTIDVEWELGGDPFRVTAMEMTIDWPALPPGRKAAAERAAARCTVHQTLHAGLDVTTRAVPRESP